MTNVELVHPMSRSVYRLDTEEGTVLVESERGRGRFTRNGEWIEGELKTADPEMCRWVGGQWLLDRFAAARSEKETS